MEGQVQVSMQQRYMVSPSRPTPKRDMYLSSLDLFWRDIHYNMRVIFFETDDAFQEVVETLRRSLADVLVEFYPLAGRLAKSSHESRHVIDCNDAGVDFVIASVDSTLADLARGGFQIEPYFGQLAQYGYLRRSDSPDLPFLSVQVNKFHGGGIALAISHSHIVMDGPSLWHFLVSWGEIARGLPLSRPPIHERSFFKPNCISNELAKLMPIQMVPVKGDINNIRASLVDKVFHFSNDVLEKLKEMGHYAMEQEEGPRRKMSSLECLFAHCWRVITRARCLPDNIELSFIVLADWRRPRSSNPLPPVPQNYFGNAITWVSASATPKALLNESFAANLARIVDAVDECTHPNTLNGTIHWLELHDTRFQLDKCWFPGVTINVASSPRFPVHQVDFGWGSPVCARPIRVGGDGGEICLLPSCHGGIDLCVKLDKLSLQRLLNDPNFLCPH